jgi:broad specificity phosphatase PhoE
MRTVVYLLRHGATAANLAKPYRLQGRRQDLPLAPFGIRQAERTRDFLAIRPIDVCYSSPLRRAVQTAEILCEAIELQPLVHKNLTECDVGRWENLDWETIRTSDPENCKLFLKNPALHGYPGGENFADVLERTVQAMNDIWDEHAGQSILVVAHHVVNRTYLASLLGLRPDQARQVKLDNCAISMIERDGVETTVTTLNAGFHLQGLAA